MPSTVDAQTAALKGFLAERSFDADTLKRVSALCEDIRRDLDLDTRLAIADRLRREAPAGDTVRLHSVLFQITGDLYHLERILHYLLLGAESIGPELLHYTYWCITRQIFMGTARPEKSDSFSACDLYRFYEELVRLTARCWNLTPPRRVPRDGPIRRVALVANQFLNDRHQPSRDCFDYAARLQDDCGLEVAIINANTLPSRVGNLFIPPFLGQSMEEYDGVQVLWMGDRRVRVASFADPAFSAAKLGSIVAAIDGYDPDLIVSFGGSTIVADLFAKADARPVLCIPTTSSVTISLAHILLGFDERNYTDHLPALYRAPFARRFRPFNFGYSLPETSDETGDFGLGEAPFVFAVVGTRLDQEVTPEFLATLDAILDRCPGALVAFAGSVEQLPARLSSAHHGARHGARMRSLGHVADIRAFYRRCHAFLNPPRQGGGGGGAYALAEGLPVVTLPWGDVASVAGEAIPVPDTAAFIERAAALFADPDLRARQSTLSRQRFDAVGDRHASVARLLGYGEEARRLLAARV
ncbi:glycosyltransferase [Azospirillum sp. sgz302134]